MVFRNVTFDNTVKYIAQTEQTKKDNKSNEIRKNSIPRKQNKNVSQKIKKSLKIQ